MSDVAKQVKGKSGLSRGVLKVMGLFSGMQIFNILCSIIKTKLVAMWLQAEGVGLFGMYNTTIETISTFTNMGLRQSSVRDISINKNDSSRLAFIVAVVRRWSLVAGLLGAIVISALAPILAESIFGDWTHCWGFVALSASMMLNAMLMGEQSILQGTGRLKALAKGSFWGTLTGLAASVPMFYYMGEDSVVWSIIVYSVFVLGFTLLYRHKGDRRIALSWGETYREGKGFVRLGICMSIASFITNIAHLAFMTYLNRTVSTEEVGLFQAGYTLVIRYAGLIFAAVGMEFFPRLSANNHSAHRVNLFVSHEITLLLLVVTPMILLFLLCRNLIVDVLYTREFYAIIPFISWAIMCNIFKAVSYCMAFSIIAKGDGKYFIFTEGVDAVVGLTLNIVLYQCMGLTGIGVAYVLWFLIYCLIVGVVYFGRYGFRLSAEAYRMIGISILVSAGALAMMELLPMWVNIVVLPIVSTCFLPPLKRMYYRNKKSK